jgi:ribose transport system substrate-binding protein
MEGEVMKHTVRTRLVTFFVAVAIVMASVAVSSMPGAKASPRVLADKACGPVTEQGIAWPKRACKYPPNQQEYVWVAANIADPFYAIGNSAWRTAARTLGVKVSLVGPQTADVSQQVSIMRQLIAKPTTAGILMYAIDYHALQPIMIQARKAGIPVIDGNGDWTNHAVRDAFVGTANQALGSSAADVVGQLLKGKGSIGIVSLITAQNHQERVAGFKAELKAKYPNIKILGIAAEDGTPSVEQKAAGAFLSAHPNVNLLWTTDAGSAYVATQVKQQGLAGKVKLVGTDRSPAEIAGICSGEVYATITQDTYSEEYTSLNFLYWLYNKKATVPDSTITKPAIVTKKNAHC